MAKTKTLKNKTNTISNLNLNSNNCSKTFCEKKVLKMSKKKSAEVLKKTRKIYTDRQKEFKNKIVVAKKNGNTKELEKLMKENETNNSILKNLKMNKSSVMDKFFIEFCENTYCNPTCKNSMFESKIKTAFYDKLPADFITDLKKNGATSACLLKKPPEKFY